MEEERSKGFADEDIGVILIVSDKVTDSEFESNAGHYSELFQKLNEIFSEKKINCSVQFDKESLSQEKAVVIVCGWLTFGV